MSHHKLFRIFLVLESHIKVLTIEGTPQHKCWVGIWYIFGGLKLHLSVNCHCCVYPVSFYIGLWFNKTPMYVLYPRPVLASGYCHCLHLSLRPSVHELVHAITWHTLSSQDNHVWTRGTKQLDLSPYCFGGQYTVNFKVKFNLKVNLDLIFIRPFEKRDVLCRGNVRPSVRPRFPDFSSTCFEISIWNLVHTFSRWHDM